MKVFPGWAVMRTLIQSDRTVVPPVTAQRSPPASRMTGAEFAGDRAFVHRGDAFDDVAVRRDQIAGFNQDDVADAQVGRRDGRIGVAKMTAPVGVEQPLGQSVAAGGAQGRRLGLAAPLGHRFGESGEQHGEPQPQRDLAGKERQFAVAEEKRAQPQESHQGGDDLGDENHRIGGQMMGAELLDRVDRGGADDRRIE